MRVICIGLILLLSINLTFETVNEASKVCSVKFSMTNSLDTPVRLLSWHSPQISINSFEITFEGKTLAPLVDSFFRGPPEDDDYLIVQPNKSVTKLVNICKYFDLSHYGNYSIQIIEPSLKLNVQYNMSTILSQGTDSFPEVTNDTQMQGNATTKSLPIASFTQSNILFIEIDEDNFPLYSPFEIQIMESESQFRDLTKKEMSEVQQALKAAIVLAEKSFEVMSDPNYVSSIYYTSFFEYPLPDRKILYYDTVKDDFESINTEIGKRQWDFTYDSTCKGDPKAYAYTNFGLSLTKITLCPRYFTDFVPSTGAGVSQSSIVFHEITHLAAQVFQKRGQQEYYHLEECKALAVLYPLLATRNAQSFAFFATALPSKIELYAVSGKGCDRRVFLKCQSEKALTLNCSNGFFPNGCTLESSDKGIYLNSLGYFVSNPSRPTIFSFNYQGRGSHYLRDEDKQVLWGTEDNGNLITNSTAGIKTRWEVYVDGFGPRRVAIQIAGDNHYSMGVAKEVKNAEIYCKPGYNPLVFYWIGDDDESLFRVRDPITNYRFLSFKRYTGATKLYEEFTESTFKVTSKTTSLGKVYYLKSKYDNDYLWLWDDEPYVRDGHQPPDPLTAWEFIEVV